MHLPVTIVEIVCFGHSAELVLSTLDGCIVTDSVTLANLPTIGDAAALAFRVFGLQRPCVDGDDAWSGYWIA
jgi:hypothetical protein